MPKKNTSGNAYGLTLLCPIINGSHDDESYADIIRDHLDKLPDGSRSLMAKVPNTYFARFYILNDVFYEGFPAEEEHLKSKYLVFSSNFHGDRDMYLNGMWKAAESDIKKIWRYCVSFDSVNNAKDFVNYIKKCQVDDNLFFNGSTDDPLDEQLKSLYLKQQFSQFAYDNQGLNATDLQKNFQDFVNTAQPSIISNPTWDPGGNPYR